MCDDDGEICESATSPATPIVTSTADQLENKKLQNPANNNNKWDANALQIELWQLDEVQQWVGGKDQFSHSLADCLRRSALMGRCC